jgi:hypothetical protein
VSSWRRLIDTIESTVWLSGEGCQVVSCYAVIWVYLRYAATVFACVIYGLVTVRHLRKTANKGDSHLFAKIEKR